MLLGSQEDNMKWVVDLLDKIEHAQPDSLAPGCDMPYDTPVDNVIGWWRPCATPTTHAPGAGRLTRPPGRHFEIELPDYADLPRPLVEVFTLDSDTCAGLRLYAWRRPARRQPSWATPVDLVEYKIHPQRKTSPAP